MRTFYTVNYPAIDANGHPAHISEVANPESLYWQAEAETYSAWLSLKLGVEDCKALLERVFPGESIQDRTWKEIADGHRRAYRAAQDGERDLDKLARIALDMPEPECDCVLPEQTCPVCQASARKVWNHAED